MPLTKQQLLIPRVLCIGGRESRPGDELWPHSNMKVGDMLRQIKGFDDGKKYWVFCFGEKEGLSQCFDPDLYPHLFKPLQWWEFRNESEMPEYVKAIATGRIYKTSSCEYLTLFLPATFEEYTEKNNNNQ